MRMPPKLLARLDAAIAARPEPKPTRGKMIKILMRQALNGRDEQKGLPQPASPDSKPIDPSAVLRGLARRAFQLRSMKR
jgi:hypothetical protein